MENLENFKKAPETSSGGQSEISEKQDFLINNISYSQLRTFLTNSGEWQNNRLLGKYDNKVGVSGAVGTVLHTFVEQYLKFGGLEKAIEKAFSTIYNAENGLTYIVPISEIKNLENEIKTYKNNSEKVKNIKKSFDSGVANLFGVRAVDFGKTGSNEKLIKDVKTGVEAFLSENIDYGEVLEVEFAMETEVFEKLGGKTFVKSPVPFKAVTDEICRTTSTKTIMVDGAPEILDPGVLFLEDTKFKSSHSDMNAEDPKYIFQAFFNYYCVLNHFGEAPKYMIFREIKTSKNKDGSSQHQTITIPFFGKTFEEYKIYFWRYILESFERIKFIQERDFLFNIFDVYNGAQEWEKQKAYYLDVEVGQLKSRIAQTSKNRFSQNVPLMGDRDPLLKNAKNIGKDVEVEDLFSVENKIRNAFRNFGVLVNFEKKVEGYSFDQYLFSTARGITMGKVKMHLPEIIQALEVEKGIRIEAPVLGTKFIGVEIPREERRFAKLKKVTKSEKRPILPIGVGINGEIESIDLSDADSPHLIVAGQTGSGKSIFLESAIESLKDKGKLHLIDPKRVGLMNYKKIAESYDTLAQEVIVRLVYLLSEMNLVYDKLEEFGYKDIYEANQNLKGKNRFVSHFILIDELASITHDPDLGKEIMGQIGQLVNLGRAAGFHVILATQRPDIKVIPGNIKANISTRVCFSLATKVDSKVVIDEEGAEQLLGKGDMLFMNRGVKRLQGFYI
ncbi:hypothetical protein DLH72_04015 [Candidatus Gracilibacteria bacterium]|nr:MAG: hypothetical protein DLH72_04015 [Candidatus Gracilibacteria bacterium]